MKKDSHGEDVRDSHPSLHARETQDEGPISKRDETSRINVDA
jgi:hypothetical protein